MSDNETPAAPELFPAGTALLGWTWTVASDGSGALVPSIAKLRPTPDGLRLSVEAAWPEGGTPCDLSTRVARAVICGTLETSPLAEARWFRLDDKSAMSALAASVGGDKAAKRSALAPLAGGLSVDLAWTPAGDDASSVLLLQTLIASGTLAPVGPAQIAAHLAAPAWRPSTPKADRPASADAAAPAPAGKPASRRPSKDSARQTSVPAPAETAPSADRAPALPPSSEIRELDPVVPPAAASAPAPAVDSIPASPTTAPAAAVASATDAIQLQALQDGALASADELIAAETRRLALLKDHRKGLAQRFAAPPVASPSAPTAASAPEAPIAVAPVPAPAASVPAASEPAETTPAASASSSRKPIEFVLARMPDIATDGSVNPDSILVAPTSPLPGWCFNSARPHWAGSAVLSDATKTPTYKLSVVVALSATSELSLAGASPRQVSEAAGKEPGAALRSCAALLLERSAPTAQSPEALAASWLRSRDALAVSEPRLASIRAKCFPSSAPEGAPDAPESWNPATGALSFTHWEPDGADFKPSRVAVSVPEPLRQEFDALRFSVADARKARDASAIALAAWTKSAPERDRGPLVGAQFEAPRRPKSSSSSAPARRSSAPGRFPRPSSPGDEAPPF